MTKKKKIEIATISAIVAPIVILLIVLSGFIIAFEIDILQDIFKRRSWNEIDYCNECWEMQITNATIEYNFYNRGGFLGDAPNILFADILLALMSFLKILSLIATTNTLRFIIAYCRYCNTVIQMAFLLKTKNSLLPMTILYG